MRNARRGSGELSHGERPSAMGALRRATHSAHRALEEALPLAAPEAGLEQLGDFLSSIAPVVFALEALVEAAAPAWARAAPPFDWPARRRAGRLLDDLAALGRPPPSTAAPAWLRPVLGRLAAEGTASRLGVLYVLEGSTLGGGLLCRHLRARLGERAGRALSYLGGHGRQTARRWRETCDHLEGQLAKEDELGVACAAAETTFACFRRAIEPKTAALASGEATVPSP